MCIKQGREKLEMVREGETRINNFTTISNRGTRG